jgi:hypothetical protein
MAGSGSYARGDQPRSVPDPNAALYDEAARRQRAYNDEQAAQQTRADQARRKEQLLGDRLFDLADDGGTPDVGHPGVAESLIPVWGSGREALADLHDKNYVGSLVNEGLAVSDAIPLKAVGGAIAKGGFRLAPAVWRTKPWEAAKGIKGARQWMTDIGFARPGQPVHHWAIPQGDWGKKVPGELKNQLWNAKPTEDAVQHGRIHGPYTVNGVRMPEFNDLEKLWYGTPDWFKALQVSIPGHLGTAAGREAKGGRR